MTEWSARAVTDVVSTTRKELTNWIPGERKYRHSTIVIVYTFIHKLFASAVLVISLDTALTHSSSPFFLFWTELVPSSVTRVIVLRSEFLLLFVFYKELGPVSA